MAGSTNINYPAIQKSVRACLVAMVVVLPVVAILDFANRGWSTWRVGLHGVGFLLSGTLLLTQRRQEIPRRFIYPVVGFYFALLAGFAIDSGILYSTANLWTVAATSFAALVVGTRFSIGCVVAYTIVLVTAAIQNPNSPQLTGIEQLISFVVDFVGSLTLTAYIANVHEQTHSDRLHQLTEQGMELANARATAINSAQIAALGEMAGGIAHEINNPLAIIDGRVRQLQKLVQARGVPDPEIMGLTDKMLATVQRIAVIVRGLRTFSRHEARPLAGPILIKKVVDDVLGLMGEKIRINSIQLELNVDPEACVVAAEVPIGQVLINLLNNAFCAVHGVPGAVIGIDASVTDNDVVIKIEDNGSGVPDLILPKLFQPFVTSKPVGEGTGIGLSISLGIAKTYGGSLIHNRQNGRTCFVMRLPSAGAPTQNAPTAKAVGAKQG